MAAFETWTKSDLKQLVQIKDLSGILLSKDNGGNLLGVELTDNGVPVDISGTVKGYAVLCDGTTQKIDGAHTGNKARIVLTPGVYNVPGPVSIVIKLDNTTIGAFTGFVRKSMTDTII